jgi:2'-5' RNA ligase
MKTIHQNPLELFFIISPPADILKQISGMKRLVRNAIGRPFDAECSIGHISLHKEGGNHAQSALAEISARLSALEPFDIQVKDFNSFKNSKTIYLDIVNKEFIHNVFENITQLRYDGIPHVTVAKNLCKRDFEHAWKTLNQNPYNNGFTCDRVKVLRKSQRRWLHYTDLYFKNHRDNLSSPALKARANEHPDLTGL